MAPAGYGNRVEGIHAVRAAISAGRVEKLFVDRALRNRPDVSMLLTRLESDLVTLVDDVSTVATTDSPQGVVADCKPISTVTLETL